MPDLDSYFDERAIIRALCRMRIAHARKRNELRFYRNMSSHGKVPSGWRNRELDGLFPPRAQWIRPKREERLRCSNTAGLNFHSLERTVERLRKRSQAGMSSESYDRIQTLVKEIQDHGLRGEGVAIVAPNITPVPKEVARKSSGHSHVHVFRPIAVYTLRDRLIIGLVAKYLVDCFDPDFDKCSYAFRARDSINHLPSHHDAVRDLLAYRSRRTEGTLWVAECDLEKFFDCVDHTTAAESLSEAVQRAGRRGIAIHPQALEIFREYLASYSFCENVLAVQEDLLARSGQAEACFDIPNADRLSGIRDPSGQRRIGVPQGGALSSLIANLILDRADRAVVHGAGRDKLFYARYCDDMILVHPNESVCASAFDRYLAAAKAARLLVHPPQQVTRYGADFWTQKSKLPYLWDHSKASAQSVPWLGFVGYQIRRDGLIRVRPRSLNKELNKQAELATRTLSILQLSDLRSKGENHISKSGNQIVFRLRQKMISMSVGRIRLHAPQHGPSQMCWASGFKVLYDHPHIRSQLRLLDGGRERQLARVRKAVRTVHKKNAKSVFRDNNIRFYGRPFSYLGQFDQHPRWEPKRPPRSLRATVISSLHFPHWLAWATHQYRGIINKWKTVLDRHRSLQR
jgi:hypothetical protein